MSEPQSAALKKITEIMREHFQSAIFVCEGEGDESNSEHLTYATCGTWTASLGLVVYAQDQLLHMP